MRKILFSIWSNRKRINVYGISLGLLFLILLTPLMMTVEGDSLINTIQLTFDDFDQHGPSFSSDGSMIVYSSKSTYDNSSTNYSVYIMNLDGSNQSQISEYATSGVFCLNDSNILYNKMGGDLVLRNLTTGEQSNISKGAYSSIHLPSISPDGKIVACVAVEGADFYDSSIVILNLTSLTIEKEVYRGGFLSTPPAFTPDGSIIALPYGTDIKFVDIETNNTWKITNVSYGLDQVRISPDGKEILYELSWADAESSIWAMSIDGNNRTFLTNGTDPSYSPDGTKIVYSADEDGDGYYDIWIMDKPPLDTDGNGTSDGNGTIDGFPYYLLLPVIVILIAIPVIYVVYKRNKHKAKEDDKEEP